MNKAVFLIKKRYNKALKKLMTMDDKFDLAITKVNEQIVKYGEARVSILAVSNWESNPALKTTKAKIDTSIEQLAKKKEEYKAKKAEYCAKEQVLKAQKAAAEACAQLDGFDFCNFDSFLEEMDSELRRTEAEIDTLNFIGEKTVLPSKDAVVSEERVVEEGE